MNALTYAKQIPIEQSHCTFAIDSTAAEAAVAADEFVHAGAIDKARVMHAGLLSSMHEESHRAAPRKDISNRSGRFVL